jgi:hypothetical protein
MVALDFIWYDDKKWNVNKAEAVIKSVLLVFHIPITVISSVIPNLSF